MALEKFHFTNSHEKEIAVPYLADAMSMRGLQKLQKKFKNDQAALTEAVIERVLGKELADEILDEWSMRDSERFIMEWMGVSDDDLANAQVSLGE